MEDHHHPEKGFQVNGDVNGSRNVGDKSSETAKPTERSLPFIYPGSLILSFPSSGFEEVMRQVVAGLPMPENPPTRCHFSHYLDALSHYNSTDQIKERQRKKDEEESAREVRIVAALKLAEEKRLMEEKAERKRAQARASYRRRMDARNAANEKSQSKSSSSSTTREARAKCRADRKTEEHVPKKAPAKAFEAPAKKKESGQATRKSPRLANKR